MDYLEATRSEIETAGWARFAVNLPTRPATLNDPLRMPALRRILKYAPAVLLGLLVVAWGLSWFYEFGIHAWTVGRGVVVQVRESSLDMETGSVSTSDTQQILLWERVVDPSGPPLGSFNFALTQNSASELAGLWLTLPMVIVVTAVAPVAIGPFLSFRFRLWHYLAYMTLVGIELAYYLRWQE